jgi:hypothetical protein
VADVTASLKRLANVLPSYAEISLSLAAARCVVRDEFDPAMKAEALKVLEDIGELPCS